MRTGAEYRESLRDGRKVWLMGEGRIDDITTHPASRQLLTAPPSPDGLVHLDFNRASNMPCAYTEFATCPFPPAANTLRFAVEAGEQVPTTTASGVPAG